jgi:hypothetical protein
MARRVKDKKAPDATLPPLAPEEAAALEVLVGRVAQALAAEPDLEALQTMVQTRPQDRAWDLHLIAALGALAHPVIPRLLTELFTAPIDKARRKALKRAFHALQSRGVAAPLDLLPPEEGLSVRETSGGLQAHVSQALGNGERYVVLEGPRDLMGGNILAARLHDQEGFRECHVFDLKSKFRQEFWDSLTKGGAVQFQAAPVSYALSLLEEAYGANPQTAVAVTYASSRVGILSSQGPPETPDLDALLGEITPADRSRLLDESRKLAQDPLFYSWIPDAEEIAPWFGKLQEILESRLVLTDQQKQARIDDLANEAVQAMFPLEARPRWRRRLWDMAHYLALQGRREDARVAAAAADDLVQDRSHLLGETVFLKTLTVMALRLSWEAEKGPAEAEPLGLLAPPTEPLIVRR